MQRTRIVFFVIVGLAIAIAAFATFRFGPQSVTQVTGLIGSEKAPFFQDERVQRALARQGLQVTVQKAGSREIAARPDLRMFDFGFPAGVPGAEKIRRETGASKASNVFFTPMVIASWKPIAELLVQQGVAANQGSYYSLDMGRFFDLMKAQTRWKDIPGNSAFTANKSVLIGSTDVRTSNSAAMYLALMSYVANDNNIVQSLEQARPLLPSLSGMFLRQGLRPSSTQEPFEDYLVKGMGHSPLVIIYEAQYVAQAARGDSAIQPEMVLMYPTPNIFTKHVLIPFNEKGEKLATALETDSELQKLAVEYGFRNADRAYFREFTRKHSVTLPENFVDVIEPPSYEVLEGMIQEIEKSYQQGGGAQ
jgi:hypothetical protein